MNKKGFISISVVYSFFLVFIAIILSIIATYSSRRMLLLEIKEDIRDVIDGKTNYDCYSKGITNLNDCIIDTYGGTSVINSQATPNFSVATSDNEYGLYSTVDDYGTSYYYRGSVPNNYIQFGQDDYGNDLYWRIVRINGDGTIRLVYEGNEMLENGAGASTYIAWNYYNTKSNNPKYVGYTYNDETGTRVDSTIKGIIDSWYENNLLDYYSEYIADTLFCNDRSFVTGSTQEYAATRRILYGNPSLKCKNEADRYTVSDGIGNGFLKYPVATLTADEIYMAGSNTSSQNLNMYLTRTGIWTMTPSYFEGYSTRSVMWMYSSTGNLSHFYGEYNHIYFTNDTLGIRPVINLKADVKLKKGNGTISSPYVLEENY